MKQARLFKIRDMRKKEKFVIDDKYLNGYARVLKPTITAVYMSLCRHADKDQEAFPAEEKIAEEHDINSRTVARAIKRLKESNIIAVEHGRSGRGKWLNNLYILLDKSQWKRPCDISVMWGHHRTNGAKPYDTSVTLRKHIRKETHKSMSDNPTNWNLKEELQRLLMGTRHIQIIGLWIKETGLKPENHEQVQSIIKRNLRPAVLLAGYSDQDIKATIKALEKTEYISKYTMETVLKFIDEIVANKHIYGKRIIKWKQIVKDGRAFMQPIYE